MRETFTGLQTTTKDYISMASGSLASSTIGNFIKKELNKANRLVKVELAEYINRDTPDTVTTAADTQYYDFPVDTFKIVAATLTIGSVAYPLEIVNSADKWNRINMIDFSGTTIPQYIFPRRTDFGIYPTPAGAYSVSLTVQPIDRDMSIEDYTTGTVTVTNADATVTGSGTTFTAAMVGRWFQTTNDQNWYQVETFTSATSIELHRTFEGTTASGAAYTLGESPNIPGELHEILPYKTAAAFLAMPRRDPKTAQAYLNYYYTGDFNNSSRRLRNARGGLLAAMRRYSGADTSGVVYRRHRRIARFDERWSATLS